MNRLFTSESVTEGHPDKVCDTIADAVLDAVLTKNPLAHSACEVCATTDFVLLMGEVSGATLSYDEIESLVRNTVGEIGYTKETEGFCNKTLSITNLIHSQSADIAQGVNNAIEHKMGGDDYDKVGAGDQGMMYGYACRETDCLMPLPITLAHSLTKRLTQVRKAGILSYLRPDGKAQVTVEYYHAKPTRVHTVVVSTQHTDDVSQEKIREDVIREVIKVAIPENLLDENTRILVNPTGRFVIGGPDGDSGLTGRKIIVDTYGGYCPHGGGAFSGKDSTKVDRSGAYFARYVCKNVVASGLADNCQLELSYAIGKAQPISVRVDSFGTSRDDDGKLLDAILKTFDFRPAAIIDKLGLTNPIFKKTTNYGHFGKEGLPWEKCDMVEKLLSNYGE